MIYKVNPATEAMDDFDRIEAYLRHTYQEFGDDRVRARNRAAARIDAAITVMRSFARHPHRGTEHPAIRPGLRSVTKDRFVYYVEIDEALAEVRVLAVFFGGADHTARMRDRLGQA